MVTLRSVSFTAGRIDTALVAGLLTPESWVQLVTALLVMGFGLELKLNLRRRRDRESCRICCILRYSGLAVLLLADVRVIWEWDLDDGAWE